MLPKPAATVLLFRACALSSSAEDYEILLVQRHSKSPFMGGAYVFPGGKVESSDNKLADGLAEQYNLDAEVASYAIAACRECFEEAGVLLCDPKPDDWQSWRERVQENADAFSQGLEEHRLELCLHKIFFWSHWITPSFEGRRYDTRFFITEVPQQEQEEIDHIETTQSIWLGPSAALGANQNQEILLMPPTVHLLDELRAYPTRRELLQAAQNREVAAILPRVNQVEGQLAIILPWDPLYANSEGEGLAFEASHPLRQTPSRIVMRNNLWTTESPT